MVLVCMILTIREMSPVVRNMLALRASCIAQKNTTLPILWFYRLIEKFSLGETKQIGKRPVNLTK